MDRFPWLLVVAAAIPLGLVQSTSAQLAPQVDVDDDKVRVRLDVELPQTTSQLTGEILRTLSWLSGSTTAAGLEHHVGGEVDMDFARPLLRAAGADVDRLSRLQFGLLQPPGENYKLRLVIHLDGDDAQRDQRAWQAELRRQVIDDAPLEWRGKFGLLDAEPPTTITTRDKNPLPSDGVAQDSRADRPDDDKLVVVVHGFNSRPSTVESLRRPIREAGFRTAMFAYPNDQPLAESAELFSRELRNWKEQHPTCVVTVVAYSMGGLVVRGAIEDPALDPRNVRQLIMISPPNHGSALARFAVGVDLFEFLNSRERRLRVNPFYAAIEDGLAEAAEDLRPNSPLLVKWNARPRNPHVEYSILLGSGGPLLDEDRQAIENELLSIGNHSPLIAPLAENAAELVADMDEVVHGLGDGVVSIERGRLDGVDDIVMLEYGHTTVLNHPRSAESRRVYGEIIRRLRGAGNE